jgi:hypothetical protein
VDFNIWDFVKAEAVFPGIIFGSYDQVCGGCGEAYVVQDENGHSPLSICPHCNTENEG